MTPRAVVSSVDEPPGRSDLGGRRTPQLQVRTTAVPAEAGRGRRSESPQLKPTILTLPRPCPGDGHAPPRRAQPPGRAASGRLEASDAALDDVPAGVDLDGEDRWSATTRSGRSHGRPGPSTAAETT